MAYGNIENNIEWTWINNGESINQATASFSQQKWITKMEKLYADHKDEMELYKNKDGSILVHFPLDWVKVSPKKQVSEEQRQKASERFKQLRAEGKLKR